MFSLQRLVFILSYLEMPLNLVQCRGAVGVFNNRKLQNEMDANKLIKSNCRFNSQLADFVPFSMHQIIPLLLTIAMRISKYNYVQSILGSAIYLLPLTKYTVNTVNTQRLC